MITVDFSSVLISLPSPIGYPDADESFEFPFVRLKTLGSEVGHIIEYQGEEYLI